ncbi:MAG: hypothetical protein ACLR02_11240 [Clostridium sp.]
MFGWILKRKNKEELVKEETLSVVIPVRMRPSQVDLLDSICALEKIDRSEFIRKIIFEKYIDDFIKHE